MPSHSHGRRALAVIAVFKFGKATLLVVLAVALLRLRSPDASAHLVAWLRALPITAGHELVSHAIRWVLGVSTHTIVVFSGIALAYAVLYTIEGIGLWRNATWAEYLTVIATSLFIPVEIWEVVARFTASKLLALIVNVAIVAYLVYLLRMQRQAHRHRADGERSQADRS